jgi:soluble lytic murein transglycosylase
MTMVALLALLPLACTAPPPATEAASAQESASVETLLDSDTVALREATADVRAGLVHANAGRAQDAVAAYARAARRMPRLVPWSHALSAAALARAGDTTGVRRHLAQTDTIIARDWGWRTRVDATLAAGDTLGAARFAAAAAAALPDTARRVQAWTRAGAIHVDSRRTAEATPLLRRAIDESIAAPAAAEAARLLGTLPARAVEDRLRIGRVYLRHRNPARAAEAYDAWIAATQPPAAERARIGLELGRAFFDARDYSTAERRLRAAAAAGGSRETTADALFMLGRTQYRQSRNADARATMLRVTRDFAGTTAAARAHFIIADIDHDAGSTESAKTHYRAVIQANGPDAALSAARLGGFALLERRPREAAAIFRDAYARANGTARQQPGYWWAHALEQAGARDSAHAILAEVRTIDPFSYYGLRAGERLNAPLWDFAVRETRTVTSVLRGEIVARVDVVDVLRAVELNDAADLEAARLIADYSALDGALYTLAEAYHAREQTFNGIRIGRELQRREGGWNRSLLQLIYPFPYREDVVRYARANNLDPYLVAGLIRQESMFNPRARSAVGALGLMQVMPQTGAAVARTLGVTGFQASRLTEPSLNLRIGTRFLADQIRRHDGRLIDAIAAYNAGPERVVRWRRYPEYAVPEIFIERIPFQETRDYVKIVQQNARIYRELYGTR